MRKVLKINTWMEVRPDSFNGKGNSWIYPEGHFAGLRNLKVIYDRNDEVEKKD
jgi:hypothetical protein